MLVNQNFVYLDIHLDSPPALKGLAKTEKNTGCYGNSTAQQVVRDKSFTNASVSSWWHLAAS